MALGTTQLNDIKDHNSKILELCGESGKDGTLLDQCNSFNYVVNHLEDWASDVPRIVALKDKLSTIAEGVTELSNNTIILTKYVDDLVNNMNDINNKNV